MKEHEIVKLINDLTEIARTFGHTQQLRERISYIVHEAIIFSGHKPKPLPHEQEITIIRLKNRTSKPNIDYLSILKKTSNNNPAYTLDNIKLDDIKSGKLPMKEIK